MQETIVSLSDIQTFFGIAFLVAATSQATRLNLYHMALVDQVSWLPSQAHQLALAQAFWHNTPHLRIRILLILLYVLIFCMFEGMYFWRIVAAEEADDDCRDAATTKPWVIVNIILTLWSYWPVIALYRTRQKHAAAMQTAASADLEAQKHEETETPEKVNKQPPRRVAVKVIRLFITLFNSRVVALITMTIFYGLQISESKDTRDSYDHGNESEWGFGQVASMMVLAASSFEFYKSFAGLRPYSSSFLSFASADAMSNKGYRASKKESNSADNIPDTQYLPPSLFLYWAHGDVVVEAAEQQ